MKAHLFCILYLVGNFAFGQIESPLPSSIDSVIVSQIQNQAQKSNVYELRSGARLATFQVMTLTPVSINSGTANFSGLQFQQLKSSSPATAANGKVLSVDANGNIILVPATVVQVNSIWVPAIQYLKGYQFLSNPCSYSCDADKGWVPAATPDGYTCKRSNNIPGRSITGEYNSITGTGTYLCDGAPLMQCYCIR
ncbi:hypothetical protein GCM10027299_12830 [Larkinella ripae]